MSMTILSHRAYLVYDNRSRGAMITLTMTEEATGLLKNSPSAGSRNKKEDERKRSMKKRGLFRYLPS